MRIHCKIKKKIKLCCLIGQISLLEDIVVIVIFEIDGELEIMDK